MSVKLLDQHTHSHDCRSRKVSLYACLDCLTIAFTTAHARSLRCCNCDKWLTIRSELKSADHDSFTNWHQADLRSEVDFIVNNFTRFRMNVLNRLEQNRQTTLPGFGKVKP